MLEEMIPPCNVTKISYSCFVQKCFCLSYFLPNISYQPVKIPSNRSISFGDLLEQTDSPPNILKVVNLLILGSVLYTLIFK